MNEILTFLLGGLCGFIGMAILLAIVHELKGGDRNE